MVQYIPDLSVCIFIDKPRSFNKFPDTSILVDLDVEYGHKDASLSDQSHVYRLFVRKSKRINLRVIDLWLQKKMPFDEDVLQALSKWEAFLV